MAKLKEGSRAPNFELTACNGRMISLDYYLGERNVILYFYPKDDTPGCTTEALGFRTIREELYNLETMILGISPDSLGDHQRFVAKYGLPFLLLSDENKKVCKKYGVWVEKTLYGKKYMGVVRTTFVINKQGKIAKIYNRVKPQGHNEEVLNFIRVINKEG